MVDIFFVRKHGEHKIYLPARWNDFYICILILKQSFYIFIAKTPIINPIIFPMADILP